MATDTHESEVTPVAVSLSVTLKRVASIDREPSSGQVGLTCVTDEDKRLHLTLPREAAVDAAVTILATCRRQA